MKKKTFLLGTMVLGALLLIGAGCSNTIQSDTSSDNTSRPSVVTQSDGQNNSPNQSSAGRYEPYDESKLAFADSGAVVLFFKAEWCPSCRVLEKDILSKKDQIPEDLTILTLDYDTELELRKKYGVTTQHTFVQVDSAGNMIKKWSSDVTLDAFTSHVK